MSSAYRIHVALEDVDLKFNTARDEQGVDVEVAQGNVWTLIRSRDRAVRRAAWEAYADGYLSVKNTMAATLVGAVKTDVFYARARRYDSALEAALGANNIPVQVFHNLIDTFRAACRSGIATGTCAGARSASRRCSLRHLRAAGAHPAGHSLCAGLRDDLRGHGAAGRGVRDRRCGAGCWSSAGSTSTRTRASAAAPSRSGVPGTHPFMMHELQRRHLQP